MPFPHLRIGLRTQIATLGMGGVLLLGLIYTQGAHTQARLQQVADESTRLHALMSAIDKDLVGTHQVETTFLLRREEALIGRREALIAGVGNRLSEVEHRVSTAAGNDPLRHADALRPSLSLYAERFRNVAAAQRSLGFDEKQGLQGRLRDAVHQTEKRLFQFEQPRLTNLMLMMRRHEKDFMLRGESKYGNDWRTRVAEFGPALAAASLDDSVKAEIKGLMTVYEHSFLAYMAGADTLKEEAANLIVAFERLQVLVADVQRSVDALYATGQSEIAASRTWTTQLMWWAIGLTVLCAGLLSLWVGQRISAPLAMMARAMEKLASGDLKVSVPRLTRRDELGAMAAVFGVFHAKMIENRDLTADQFASRTRSEAERRAAMLALADRLESELGAASQDLSGATARMQEEAKTVSGVVAQTRERAVTVAAASGQTSANVQMISAAVEELTASISEVATQVARSTGTTGKAAEEADRTSRTIRDLAEAVRHIHDVVGLIATVADQTNLLALNATIEAARAGEAGRGFAVVAGEVKALAGQTARATADIRGHIATIQNATSEAVEAASGIAGTVRDMNEIATAIASTMQQQRAATQEIAGSIMQASTGTQVVSETIAAVGADADRAAGAAHGVSIAAQEVAGQSRALAGTVTRFLAEVRAA